MRVSDLSAALRGLPPDAPVQLYIEWSRSVVCEVCEHTVSVEADDYYEIAAALAEPAYDGERGEQLSLTLLAGPAVR